MSFLRVDFMPSPKGSVNQTRDPKGCLRCDYPVYEAEKLIAAGRVIRESFGKMFCDFVPSEYLPHNLNLGFED